MAMRVKSNFFELGWFIPFFPGDPNGKL